jgi:hypothetical protein
MRHCDHVQHECFIEREPPLQATAARCWMTTSVRLQTDKVGNRGQLPVIARISYARESCRRVRYARFWKLSSTGRCQSKKR